MSDHDDGPPMPEIRDKDLKTDMSWISACVPQDVTLDPYRKHIADLELSDEEANEFLGILWNIMSHFVDLGFACDAVSLVEHLTTPDPCGKHLPDSRAESSDMID